MVVALAVAFAAVVPMVAVPVLGGVAGAQSAGSSDVSAPTANAEGWWDVMTSAPETPLGATAPPLTAPAPDVPEGTVPVAMRAGQPARVGAIGIELTAPAGSTVNRLIMTLAESEESSAQQGNEPSVKACPITSFLVPAEGGKATDAPEADCSVAEAIGERSEDGTWTFDLTAIAAAWFDPFESIPVQGVRLDPVGEFPDFFQVAFTGFEDATFDADIVPGEGGDAFASGGDLGGGSVSDSFGGSTTDFSTPRADLPAVTTDQAPSSGNAPSAQAARPVAASRAGDTIGNFPLSLIPAVLGTIAIALLAALALGPLGGRRSEATRRQGGVSRALAERLATTRARRA